jgi:hypothetical protein
VGVFSWIEGTVPSSYRKDFFNSYSIG